MTIGQSYSQVEGTAYQLGYAPSSSLKHREMSNGNISTDDRYGRANTPQIDDPTYSYIPEGYLNSGEWQSGSNMFTPANVQPSTQQFYSASGPLYPTYAWQNLQVQPSILQNQARGPLSYNAQAADLSLGHYFSTQPTEPRQDSPSSDFSRSPTYPSSPGLSTPLTPGGTSHVGSLLDLQEENESNEPTDLFSHRQQVQFFRDAVNLPGAENRGPFIPQTIYKPHTNSDRRRYVEEVDLEAPIYFWTTHPLECGIPLMDAMYMRVMRLQNKDDNVFRLCGPSISIRVEWPGYRQWSRQIPTKDFRSPPRPITREKLAKNVAKCVKRFIEERKHQEMEEDADPRWKVGTTVDRIRLEDIILVSIHHVSLGSWQPQFRLARPFVQHTF